MGYQKSARFFEIALVLILLAHAVFTMWAGRLLQMDEVFFKAAGREWAQSGRFAAPECSGFLKLQPPCEDIWFAQPPVYPFVFGVFTKLFGFGKWQSILFDELIHVLQAWLTFRLARRIEGGILSPSTCFILGAAVLLMGTIGRSDELAVCFGLLGLLPIVAGPMTVGRVVFSGACLGVTAGVSAAAGAMMGIMAMSLVILRDSDPRQLALSIVRLNFEGHGRRLRLAMVWVLASIGALAAVLAPILIPRPDAYYQYMGHVHYQYLERVAFAYLMNFVLWVGAYYLFFTFLLLLVGVLCFVLNRKVRAEVHWAELWVGPIGALIFLALNFPYKYTYLWFIGPWLLVAAAANIRALAPHVPVLQVRILTYLTIVAATMGAIPMARQTVIFLSLPADQSFEVNLARVRESVKPGDVVVTNDFWWGLGNECKVYDVGFGTPAKGEIDYFVMTQNDTGIPGHSQTLRPYMVEYFQNHFVVVRDDMNRQSVAFLGVPMHESSYGFGAIIAAQMGPRAWKYEAKPTQRGTVREAPIRAPGELADEAPVGEGVAPGLDSGLDAAGEAEAAQRRAVREWPHEERDSQ